MKIKLLFSFLLSGLALFAQQNETKKIIKIQGNDTTIIMINGRIDQLDTVLTDSILLRESSSVGASDSTQIRIGNMKIVILESNNGKDAYTFEKEFGNDFKDAEDFGDGNAIWSGFGVNANGFMNTNNELSSTTELSFLTLDPSKSIGLQWNFAEKRLPIFKEYLGIVTGLGLNWNRYAIKGNFDFSVVNDTLFANATGINYSKNILSSTYIQAPLLLQISTNKNANKAWNISAGVVGGIRLDARQVQKWEADGKKNKDKTKDDFQFNAFQASLMAVVGYGDWSLYMNYGLSDVFNEGAAIKLHAVNAGILRSF